MTPLVNVFNSLFRSFRSLTVGRPVLSSLGGRAREVNIGSDGDTPSSAALVAFALASATASKLIASFSESPDGARRARFGSPPTAEGRDASPVAETGSEEYF